ncbi:MAG: FecR domain-containing protein [bacterium]
MDIDTHKFHEDEFLGRWVADELSSEEQREFGAWIHAHPQEQEFFDDLKNLWQESATISLQKGLIEEERWRAISRQSNLQPKSKTLAFTRGVTWKIYAVAATVVILIASYVWWSAGQIVSITAPAGTRMMALLPDASEVTLNAESTLRYNKHTWSEKRVVQFDGEGFFKIETGAPFSVQSNFVTTEVLGTSFNIKARGRKVEIACLTGRVRVASKEFPSAQVILTAGQESIVIEERPPTAPKDFNPGEKIGWLSGVVHFQSTPLAEVFAEIQRQAGVQLQITANIENLTFTGKIETSHIKEALEIICLSSGLSYSATKDSIFTVYK